MSGHRPVYQMLYNCGPSKLTRFPYARQTNSTCILRAKCKASQNGADQPTFPSLYTNKNTITTLKNSYDKITYINNTMFT